MGDLDKQEGYRFYCPSHDTKIVESSNVKFFANGDHNGSFKIKYIVYQKERKDVSVPIDPKRIDDTSTDRNIPGPQLAFDPNDPVINYILHYPSSTFNLI